MIVVLDTNVIISALLSTKGPPAKVIDRWEADEFEVAISKPLLDELERARGYDRVKKYFKDSQGIIKALLKRLKTVGVFVDPKIELHIIEDDPDDNRVLECALAANASYIISGDEHLLGLEEYKGIIINTSTGFLTALDIWKKRLGS
jgi:putative PIN family toxin of toxin-antitoxin system